MPISRRALLTSALAAGLLRTRNALALAGEPFPVFESDAKEIPYKFRRREVDYDTAEPAGAIVIDAKKRFLYQVLGAGKAMRYGVGVGKAGKTWSGETVIGRKEKWPMWTPTPDHIAERPEYAEYLGGMPGGPKNPMGARALYLYKDSVDTIYRIHGSIKPKEIGNATTAGCFSMINIDVIHLFDRVEVGTRVVVL